ncbi:MAG TPA: O-antigen ligase family protein [Conexibacter sp.]|nr:O-antigen ligase family protein [Conexibacter sp.]
MDVVRRLHPLLLVPPALVVALALDQGGFDPSAWVWSGALAAWAAATAAVVSRDLRLSRTAWAWLASAGVMLAWVALSWLWSDRRTQTVLEMRRTAVYAAVVLALVALARRAAERQLLLSTHGAITAVVVYALARYLTETRTHDTFEGTLLAQPLGYANALGAIAAIGVVLGVGLVAHAPPGPGRASIAATVPLLATALPLTQSRGAAVALGIGLFTTVACADDAAPLVRAALLVAPGSGLAAIAAATSRLSDGNAEPYRHAAWVVGAAAIASAGGTAVAVARARSAPQSRRQLPRIALIATAAVGLAAVGVASGSTEPRTSLWGVAWHQFERHAAFGSGAGTFALAWARSGLIATRGGALDAHSLYLETLAELGLVGLVLVLAFLALPLLHARRAPVAAGAYVVFLVHAGLDWDWEMPAVILTGLCCGASALAAGASQPRAVTPRARAAIVVLAVALGALSIAGARSSSEPGVAPPRSVVVVLGAGVAVLPLAVPVALPVLLPRSGLGGAGREHVAVAEVRLDGLRRHRDQVPRTLLRVGAVADLHAVLLARGSVLAAGRAVLTA